MFAQQTLYGLGDLTTTSSRATIRGVYSQIGGNRGCHMNTSSVAVSPGEPVSMKFML